MDELNKVQTRKRFIVFGITVAGLFTAFKFFIPKKKRKVQTMKMLTSEGKLVEIEISRLPSKRKKIKDDDIHTWIQRKPSL